MKKSYLLFIAVGLCCLDACNKEVEITEIPESPESVKMISETITANLGADTKVTIANTASDNFAWIAGDNIAVHVSNGDIHKYVLTSDDGASGASASASSASFTVVYPEGYSRDAFAVYPSTIVATDAANYGQSGKALDVTLPNEYTLEQVSGTTSPCPMIASNTGSGWDFYHLCGLLRLTVNSIPPTATKITVNFDKHKVYGAFSVDATVTPGSSSIATSTTTDKDNDEITITFDAAGTWRDGMDINLPLPTGEYTDITVKAFAGTSELLSVTRPVKVGAASYDIAKAAGKKCTASLPAFSVSSSTRVAFAPGNLVATISAVGVDPVAPTAVTWSFHANQYDHCIPYQLEDGKIKSTSTDISSYYDGIGDSFDLFGYGTSGWDVNPPVTWPCPYPWNTLGVFTDYGPNADLTGTYANCDWGVFNIIKKDEKSNYPAGYWRTPTGGPSGEWYYLLQTRGESLRSLGIVNGVPGLIILPDYFVDPATNESSESVLFETGNYYFNNTDANPLAFEHNVYNGSNWTAMEKYGAIFLPAVGWKGGNAATQSYLMESDKGKFYLIAQYWSSTIHPDNSNQAYQLRFGRKNGIEATSAGGRNRGLSVRLVHDLN